MTCNVLYKKYFDWVCDTVWNKKDATSPSFSKLFKFLFSIPFIPAKETDDSRVDDGLFLRNVFAGEFGIDIHEVINALNERNHNFCSILEMMVSLSIRIEDHIMADSDFGNRTGQWFWEMIVSLGLFGMDDVQFSEPQAKAIIDNFQSLNYAPNGQGGLFTLKKPRGDMRKYDIWYQMQFYISENYPSDDFI